MSYNNIYIICIIKITYYYAPSEALFVKGRVIRNPSFIRNKTYVNDGVNKSLFVFLTGNLFSCVKSMVKKEKEAVWVATVG